jgi:hypothetical protein
MKLCLAALVLYVLARIIPHKPLPQSRAQRRGGPLAAWHQHHAGKADAADWAPLKSLGDLRNPETLGVTTETLRDYICDVTRFAYDRATPGDGDSYTLWLGKISTPRECCLSCAERIDCRAWTWSSTADAPSTCALKPWTGDVPATQMDFSRGKVSGSTRSWHADPSLSTLSGANPVSQGSDGDAGGKGVRATRGITLAVYGDVSHLDSMLRTRALWNATMAISVLILGSKDLATAEDTLFAAASTGPLLRWCAYMPPMNDDQSAQWTCESAGPMLQIREQNIDVLAVCQTQKTYCEIVCFSSLAPGR